ncbi:TetR/AcrR family transcriptional regulator [Brevundimonas sp.]|uniref:TetR/AcrR family transcriptional regulator n=1 Tax=Brevundimonas sp. TaxID=1871086 RepID=UPI001A2E4208|nr:TetR/AcrR family transcriptional regulator [Brevundimonas sp.]MBJ7483148.1 TetR/AcrR family transcriptional regulator [Brevundimonas sp.]
MTYNLVGQRLGRKGQETRERVISAMLTLLDDPEGPPVTLTAVAKEASVGMTTLYLYFPAMGDLLLAVLRCVMDTAGDAFMKLVRDYWRDETLTEDCLAFHRAHYLFWNRHARLLRMRNSFADDCDLAVLSYRSQATRPLLDALTRQMGCDLADGDTLCAHLATVVLTGLERVATVVTTPHFHITSPAHGTSAEEVYIDNLITAQSRLTEIAIRDQRRNSR